MNAPWSPYSSETSPREPLASINGSWSSREHILFVTQDFRVTVTVIIRTPEYGSEARRRPF